MVMSIVHIAMHYYIDICILLENVWDINTENSNYKPEENGQCEKHL